MRSSQRSFSWFFGAQRPGLQISGARLVSGEEVLRHCKLEIRLLPVSGGETNDALFVHLPQHRLLFVAILHALPGTAAPLGRITGGLPGGTALVRTLAPRRLIHAPCVDAVLQHGRRPWA